jgi:hypothetical protein
MLYVPDLGDKDDPSSVMKSTLSSIVNNDYLKERYPGTTKIFHAYIFVYNASERDSYLEMAKLYSAIENKEKSDNRGRAKDEVYFIPQKFIIGNKCDLRTKKQVLNKNDKTKFEKAFSYKVSALTNF